MGLIKRMRKQPAVYWAQTPKDEFGSVGFAEPVQIKCRWEDRVGQVLDSKGELVNATSVVYVDRDIELADKLKLGELDSMTLSDPSSDAEAFTVAGFEKVPNLRAKEFLRIAYL